MQRDVETFAASQSPILNKISFNLQSAEHSPVPTPTPRRSHARLHTLSLLAYVIVCPCAFLGCPAGWSYGPSCPSFRPLAVQSTPPDVFGSLATALSCPVAALPFVPIAFLAPCRMLHLAPFTSSWPIGASAAPGGVPALLWTTRLPVFRHVLSLLASRALRAGKCCSFVSARPPAIRGLYFCSLWFSMLVMIS